ncbi:hypothetical protein HFN71_28655 [Rhizobium laguerreae]|uniref:hypothetical protein n=1 Tax=Rhizobium laguerreae TaxID=1076926 RepID=UPI001C923B87|nr:hypothetical protein [Rhizobium laguerreae]MBY3543657.1 hypothetical protein [Rhizobium laguerreae]
MAHVPWALIREDAQFQRECEMADKKANKAAKRVKDRLMAAEEKEVERHRKAMAEIDRKRKAIFRDVFSAIYDPLEQEAFARAERRLAARAQD